MITKRDVYVALLAAAVSLAAARLLAPAAERAAVVATDAARGLDQRVPAGRRAPISLAEFEGVEGSILDWDDVSDAPTEYGSRRPFLRTPTTTLSELEVTVAKLDPAKPAPVVHRHVDEELAIIKDGTFEAQVNGRTRRIGPGSVVLQTSNELHGMRNVGAEPGSVYVIRWRPRPRACGAE